MTLTEENRDGVQLYFLYPFSAIESSVLQEHDQEDSKMVENNKHKQDRILPGDKTRTPLTDEQFRKIMRPLPGFTTPNVQVDMK